MSVNISQSLIKRIWDYFDGNQCGLAVKEIDILKNYQSIPTAPMKLGQYFEYLCTGQTLRDGSTPETPVTQKGALSAEAKRAAVQAENFKKMLEHYDFEVLSTGEVFEHQFDDEYKLKIVTDAMIKTPKNDKAILDIKYSGLLGDKWSETGWHLGTFKYRKKLFIQAVMYKYVYEKVHGVVDIPFYYAIHSSKNENDFFLWEVELPNYEDIMTELEGIIYNTITAIIEDDFSPIPDFKRCSSCPLKNDCMFKADFPQIELATVYSFEDENRKV